MSVRGVSAGGVEVELGCVVSARGFYVKEGEGRQVQQHHEEDVCTMRKCNADDKSTREFERRKVRDLRECVCVV